MKIEQKKLSELREYENNPRINDMAVEPVANSIKEFGFKVPIVATSDGVIIAGHTRYKAAKQLKMKTVPVIIADELTPEQVKAYRLADNKVSELAEWDWDKLSDELDSIGVGDEYMAMFGFDEAEVGEDREYKSKEIDIDDMDNGWDGCCPHCGFHFCETKEEE